MKKHKRLFKLITAMLFFALLVIAPSTKGNAATLKDDNGYKNVCMNASCIRIGDNIYMQDDLNIVQFNLKNKKFKTIFKGISAKKAYYIKLAYGKYLYFIRNERENLTLYRYDTKTNKSKKITKLDSIHANMYIYNNKLYYYNYYYSPSGESGIYCCNLDGSKKKRLTSGQFSLGFTISNNYIYGKDSTYYYQCKLNGKNIKKISKKKYTQINNKVTNRICATKGDAYSLSINKKTLARTWKPLGNKKKATYTSGPYIEGHPTTLYKNKKLIKNIGITIFSEPSSLDSQLYVIGNYIIVGRTNSWVIYTTSGKPIAHLFGSTVSVY